MQELFKEELKKTRDALTSERMLREDCEEQITLLKSRLELTSDLPRNTWKSSIMPRLEQQELGGTYIRKSQSAREYVEYPRERIYDDFVLLCLLFA